MRMTALTAVVVAAPVALVVLHDVRCGADFKVLPAVIDALGARG